MPSRASIYNLLIAVAVGMAVAHILAATLVLEPALHRDESNKNDKRRLWPSKRPNPMPTFSSNDRSRWATVRALVDEGTYVVGRRDPQLIVFSALAPLAAANSLETVVLSQAGTFIRTTKDTGIVFEDGWQTIDRVLHPDSLKFYSSKPPLLSTLMAGLYWLLQALTGWTLASTPAEMVRTLVLLVNALPFGLYLYILGRWVERYGTTDWGRLFVMSAACFATLVTPFLITFNNHTLGTFSVLFALASMLTIWERQQQGGPDWALGKVWYHFVLAGFFAAFAVINELPALSFAFAVFVLLLWWAPVRTLAFFVPPAVLIAGGFFYTNYLAVGQYRPAYSEFGSPWYEYEGSHWRKAKDLAKPPGIDFARFHESRAMYAFNLTLGHHGLFSLTPIWFLAAAGMLTGWMQFRKPRLIVEKREGLIGSCNLPWFLPGMTLGLSLVVIGFYLVKSDNYGGWSVGPRWLIWLTPLFLLTLLPVADWLSTRRWGRGVGLFCLGFSALSAHYPGWNAWRMPWIYDLFDWLGWIPY